MTPFALIEGDSPIILGMPHGGGFVPDEVRAQLNDVGRGLTDTDWHIDRLYDGLLPGATVVRATFHRYVIDANRDPSGASLYPGQNTTGLVPETDFDGRPLWQQAPDTAEVERRRLAFHAPYHAAVEAQIVRLKTKHKSVIFFDCHSIRSHIPFLFEGTLPVFNIGTNNGATCAPAVQDAVRDVAAAAQDYTHVVNGRFRGGWSTRHYGRPQQGLHAIQLELAQRAYMAEQAPWTYDETKAQPLRHTLRTILGRLAQVAPTLSP